MIHERHGNLKYKYGNRSFWCRGYYVDTEGKNEKRIEVYIKNWLHEDMVNAQITLRDLKTCLWVASNNRKCQTEMRL